MKFIYLGGEGAPEVSTHFGVEFVIGKPSEVTDEAAIQKLLNHPHFEKVSASAPAAVTTDGERDELIAQHVEMFGKKPHHKKSNDQIIEALNANND